MKTKGIWIALVIALVAVSANAQALVTKGSKEIGINGKLDFHGDLGTEYNLGLRYAYFIIDRMSVGVLAGLSNNDYIENYGVGLLTEYNFGLPESWKPGCMVDLVPYLGLSAKYGYSHIRNPPTGFNEDDHAVVGGAEVGVKFFMTESTAILLSVVGDWASEEIYADDGEATDVDLYAQVGMRFCF